MVRSDQVLRTFTYTGEMRTVGSRLCLPITTVITFCPEVRDVKQADEPPPGGCLSDQISICIQAAGTLMVICDLPRVSNERS